jgi:hypothetical protein
MSKEQERNLWICGLLLAVLLATLALALVELLGVV